jgi:hypothetical protein
MEKQILKIYQKFGDYFTGNHRKRYLYLSVTMIFVALLIVSILYKIVVSIDTLYWVFSSLVQALLALVALMGVVSIFKLQSLKSSEDQLLIIAREQTYTYYYGAPPPTIELLLEKIEPIIKSSNLGPTNHLYVLRENIKDIKLPKKLVVDYAIQYTVYTFSVVLLSLLFLIFSTQISLLYAGVPTLFLIFIFTSFSLFLAAKGFSYSIQ